MSCSAICSTDAAEAKSAAIGCTRSCWMIRSAPAWWWARICASPEASRRRISAAPMSDEAPATRISSRLMNSRPDLRLRYGLAVWVGDRRLDVQAFVGIGEVRDLARDHQLVADEG